MTKKTNQWYDRYCKPYIKSPVADEIDAVKIAAKLSYRSSVLRALNDDGEKVGFKDKKSEASTARESGEDILKEYLIDVLNNPSDFEEKTLKTWGDLRNEYHDKGITWYKYGNAQKWTGMAVKYFITILDKFDIEPQKMTDLKKACWFPVDGIMIKEIKKDKNISFNGSWSECDDIKQFKEYIKDVKNAVSPQPLFDYEYDKWNP